MASVRAGLGYAALVVTMGAAIASGETNEAALVTDGQSETAPLADETPTGQAGPTDATGSVAFSIGDKVALGDWHVVVHAVTDPYENDNPALAPERGNRWVAIDTEVFNVGREPRDVAAIWCFDLQDELNRNFEQEIFSGSTVGAPSGEVAPGASRRGTIVYEVPVDASGLRLNFKCELFSTGSATIDL